jgi:DNA-binding transcriptional ArsR family regulator
MSNQAADLFFDALGEPARRRIVEVLHEGAKPVGQLAGDLKMGRPGVSKHLKVLESAGLVSHHSVGTRNLYALSPGGINFAREWIIAMWDTTLSAYAAEVRRTAVSRKAESVPSRAKKREKP